jgi:TolA-binding protein
LISPLVFLSITLASLVAKPAVAPAPVRAVVVHPAVPAEPGSETPWWNAAWPYRCRIKIAAGEGDVAQAAVFLAGHTTPDGHDLRVVDQAGLPVAFAILYHDPQLSTLLRIRAVGRPVKYVWLYYGNRDAPAIDPVRAEVEGAQQALVQWRLEEPQRQGVMQGRRVAAVQIAHYQAKLKAVSTKIAGQPGSGLNPEDLKRRIAELEKYLADTKPIVAVPEPVVPAAWNPQRGLLLKIYRKPQPDYPQSIPELLALAAKGHLEGAGFRPGISDGYNPFGLSDHYISIYEGYLRIDQAGDYSFCSSSDEGSWIVINDRLILSWPGPHTWAGSQFGEKHGEINLPQGVAHVQYYHEEGTGTQMAFMGWRPPGAKKYTALPPAQWLGVRLGTASLYEAAGGGLVAVPRAQVYTTYWIRESDDLQATQVLFDDLGSSGTAKVVHRHWTFGDGLNSDADSPQHVYFRVTKPTATLEVVDDQGRRDRVTCAANVYYLDLGGVAGLPLGNAEQYAKLSADYDVNALEQNDLAALVEFWNDREDWPRLARAAEALVRRFPTAVEVPRLAALAAQSCLKPEAYDPQLADRLLQVAMARSNDENYQRQLALQWAQLATWNLGPEQVRKADNIFREQRNYYAYHRAKPPNAAIRHCVIGLGDVALLAGDRATAEKWYRQAEALRTVPIAPEEGMAKLGTYPYAVQDLLTRDEYEGAHEILDEWEDLFPLQKLEGLTFFLRGKVFYVSHPGPQAQQYFELSERVAPKGLHVPESVWLRALNFAAQGKQAEAAQQYQRICTDFSQSEFVKAAAENLQKMPQKQPFTEKNGNHHGDTEGTERKQ